MSGKERKETSKAEGGRETRWNRLTLRFFGPPHIGDVNAPAREVDPDPLCPHCNQHESQHLSFRTDEGKTLRRCPR